MEDTHLVNLLTDKDRELLSDLSATFDLGTQSIIGQRADEGIDELTDSTHDDKKEEKQ